MKDQTFLFCRRKPNRGQTGSLGTQELSKAGTASTRLGSFFPARFNQAQLLLLVVLTLCVDLCFSWFAESSGTFIVQQNSREVSRIYSSRVVRSRVAEVVVSCRSGEWREGGTHHHLAFLFPISHQRCHPAPLLRRIVVEASQVLVFHWSHRRRIIRIIRTSSRRRYSSIHVVLGVLVRELR